MFAQLQALTRFLGARTDRASNGSLNRRFRQMRPAVEFLEDRWAPTATTTSLEVVHNATTGGNLVTLTATVAPSPGDAGSVTFRDNGAPIAGGTIPLQGGVAMFSTSAFAIGTHPVTAVYSGAAEFDASVSPATYVVGGGATNQADQPRLISIMPNGGLPDLQGGPHSRLVNLQYNFDQPVELSAGAISVSLHTKGVTYIGFAQPNGMGAVPELTVTGSTDKKTWTVSFSGTALQVALGNKDGIVSLKDGVYDFNIDAAKVHADGRPSVTMVAAPTFTIHRLANDINEPTTTDGGTPSVDFRAIVNSADQLAVRIAWLSFKGDARYKAYLDTNGDELVGAGTKLSIIAHFNKGLTWKV